MAGKPQSIRLKLQALVADIVANPEAGDTAARLASMGFPSEPELVDVLHEVSKRFGASSPERLAATVQDLLASPYPEGALINFLRFLDIAGTSSAFLNTAAGGRPMREILGTIFGSSQYMADIIIRNPGYLYWLIEKATWERRETTDTYSTGLRADAENFQSLEARLDAARRFQRRMLLKIGVKDLLGLQTVEETTACLSSLADAVVRGVLEMVWLAAATPAQPQPPSGFAVLALGKLGGRELNYSSDIDLVYVCADTDEKNFDFYHRLARRLTSAISDVTAEGYFYRVDLRLRPDGATGPLVNSLTSMRIYYENRGRPWEFQALLKARVIAGEAAVGNTFLNGVAGLAFNPSLSYSPVEAIGLMRNRIRENISVEDRSFNIKLMEGGIRDIEFIVQTLQLLYGNKYPELRVTNTLDGIAIAHKRKLIKRVEYRTLTRAYRFFRLVEHRLQMMHQVKTHSIPRTRTEVQLLARRIANGPLAGFTHTSFLSTLTSYINEVRLLSDSFFAADSVPESALLLLSPEDDAASETLARLNFADAPQARRVLQSLAYGSFPELVGRNTRAAFQKLLPTLLEELSHTGDPNGALANFSRLADASKNVSSFYDFLRESVPARVLLRNLAGTSSVLTGKLCVNFEILDSLLEDPSAILDIPVSADAPVDLLFSRNVETDRSRLHKRVAAAFDRKVVAAWFSDMQAGTFPERIATTLTRSARQLITSAFDSLAGGTGAALFAMGSYAVGEPRLGSDVDLLVVVGDAPLEPVTRALQLINRNLSESSVLKLDYRLRGEGANAPLVQDLEYYRGYFAGRVSPWETVAFAKCACWGGDHNVAREFGAVLRARLASPPAAGDLVALIETRGKLESLVAADAELLETKRSAGGRYDIEYLCAIGLAARGRPVPVDSGTVERLRLLAADGHLTRRALSSLEEALAFYTRVDYLLELQGFSLPTNAARRDELARYLTTTLALLGMGDKTPFEERMRAHKAAVRRCYQRLVDSLA
ncbi:MAG: nucleotidyltransferase domain-containing protein [Candidatus Krumholzibacteriia bacterium]